LLSNSAGEITEIAIGVLCKDTSPILLALTTTSASALLSLSGEVAAKVAPATAQAATSAQMQEV
jgi:hypothetical protein